MALLPIALAGALCSAVVALWRKPATPRGWPLLLLALAPQLAALLSRPQPGLFFCSMVAVFGCCLCNLALPGAALAATGVGLNLLAMAWHGGAMPIRTDILAAVGVSAAPGTLLHASKDIAVLASPVWLLSDWIIIPLPRGPLVASPGDFLIVAGVTWWLLFSRLEKEHDYADAGRSADVARTSHAPAARAE
ncbi:MAG TPA: DUF5317 family protein [Kouleothrix sp.]|uniref:DUF5317 family protein n=1 Tax=Kouleothrix sp. TaxID=2779161 RepID=UPI002B593E04|nr:DUF5317 family protein [Kouleothrix sp.]HRC76709.1 DUF5317 family protein [Kouleothrix sp.]